MTNAEARFNKSHVRKVYVCLAGTCHLHFWQNDRDFLRATAVTRGWNGYRNKSQHRKSTLEKKILPPFQQGFEPATFQSRVRCSNHWAIPAPKESTKPTVLKTGCMLTGNVRYFLFNMNIQHGTNKPSVRHTGCYFVWPVLKTKKNSACACVCVWVYVVCL